MTRFYDKKQSDCVPLNALYNPTRCFISNISSYVAKLWRYQTAKPIRLRVVNKGIFYFCHNRQSIAYQNRASLSCRSSIRRDRCSFQACIYALDEAFSWIMPTWSHMRRICRRHPLFTRSPSQLAPRHDNRACTGRHMFAQMPRARALRVHVSGVASAVVDIYRRYYRGLEHLLPLKSHSVEAWHDRGCV